MLPLERQNNILDILSKRKSATVEELCAALYSSGATIRRDLKMLEGTGLIRRTHGGAVHVESGARDFPLPMRETENQQAKSILSAHARRHIQDGQTIFLDSSSTACHLARMLTGYSHLRVITNGLKTANILAETEGVEVYCTGGRLRERAMSFVGEGAIAFVEDFYADFAFFSCRGADPIIGITDSDEQEAALKRAYIRQARQAILLCDSSKLGKQYFCRIAPISAIAEIVCDTPLPPTFSAP